MFLHLVYVSAATNSFSDAALSDLVARSKIKNEQHEITAVLLHQHGTFLHGIEGEETKVRALLAIVRADPRHRDSQVLVETRVSERLFTGQPMGFHNADLEKLKRVKAGTERLVVSPTQQGFSWQGCIALQLLVPFRS